MSPSQIEKAEKSALALVHRHGRGQPRRPRRLDRHDHAHGDGDGEHPRGCDLSVDGLWAEVDERWNELRFDARGSPSARSEARCGCSAASEYLGDFADDSKTLLQAEGNFTVGVRPRHPARHRRQGRAFSRRHGGDRRPQDRGRGSDPDEHAGAPAARRLPARLRQRCRSRPDGAIAGGAARLRRDGVRGKNYSNRTQQPMDAEELEAFRERLRGVAAAISGAQFGARRSWTSTTRSPAGNAASTWFKQCRHERLRVSGNRRQPSQTGPVLALVPAPQPIGAAALAAALGLPPPTPEQQRRDRGPPRARPSSWPAPAAARPRRWRTGCSGCSPTATPAGRDPRTHLHPQGGRRARRAHPGRIEQLVTGRASPTSSSTIFDVAHPSPPTTPSPARSSATTPCCSAASPSRCCSARPSAWLLARQVVSDHGDDRLVQIGKKPRRRHGCRARAQPGARREPSPFVPARRARDDLAQFLGMSPTCRSVRTGARRSRTDFAAALEAVGSLPPLLDLAERFQAEKRRRGFVEFSDQVALALQVCHRSPAVSSPATATSTASCCSTSTRTPPSCRPSCCARLFAGHAGDGGRRPAPVDLRLARRELRQPARLRPRLRGARADGADAPGRGFDSRITWRNPRTVLDGANALVAPLTLQAAEPSPTASRSTRSRCRRQDGPRRRGIARDARRRGGGRRRWFAARLGSGAQRATPATARSRRDARRPCSSAPAGKMDLFADVLRGPRRSVPRARPRRAALHPRVIADVVSVLRVVHDPAAGSELLRLLTGGRWRIGAADLHALAGVAGWLASHDWRSRPLSDELKRRAAGTVVADEGRSLVDALDFVATAPETPRPARRVQRRRPRTPARGRRAAGLAPPPRRPGTARLRAPDRTGDSARRRARRQRDPPRSGPANLYAFHDCVVGFLDSDEQGTLGAVPALARPGRAAGRPGPRGEAAEPGHRAAAHHPRLEGSGVGLSSPFRAWPTKSLPAQPRETRRLAAFGELPYRVPRRPRPSCPSCVARGARHPVLVRRGRHRSTRRRTGRTARRRGAPADLCGHDPRASRSCCSPGLLGGGTRQSARGPSRYLRELAEAGLIARPAAVSSHRRGEPASETPGRARLAVRPARHAPRRRGARRRSPVRAMDERRRSADPPTRMRAESTAARSRSAGAGCGARRPSRCRRASRRHGSRTTSTTRPPSRQLRRPMPRTAVPGDPARHAVPLLGRTALRRRRRPAT